MNSKELLKAYGNVSSDFNQSILTIEKGANELARTADAMHRTREILDDLDRQFALATGLNSTDTTFLFLAIGLQMARQYLLSNNTMKLKDEVKNGKIVKSSSQRGDKLMQTVYEHSVGLVAPAAWKKVLFQSVPYDATSTSDLISYSAGLSGYNHRYRTLGHDPILGWIFGTANIITNSLTKSDFETFYVKDMHIMRRYPLGVAGMMQNTIKYSMEEPYLLAVAVARQAIHFGSDYFTKQGLPLPFIATLDNSLAQEMITKWQVDMWSVTKGAAISSFINQLIAVIHTLFFNGATEQERKLYEVKTRKILMYSNAVATSTNLAVVAAFKKFEKLDIGGMSVTIYRLITDQQVIRQVKEDFVFGSYRDMIIGDSL